MNGWNNKETWLMVNWGMNDLGMDALRHIMEDSDTTEYEKIEAIESALFDNMTSYADDLYSNITCSANPVSELLTHALNVVDWNQLADAWYRGNVDNF